MASTASHDPAVSRTRDTVAKTIEFVRLGFHDCSLNFTVRTGNADVVPHLLDAAGPYNDFDPDRVLAALAEVLPEAMGIEFGRESSPVLYVDIPFWTHQRMGDETRTQGRLLEEAERVKIAQAVVDALRECAAETVSYQTVTSQGVDRIYLSSGQGIPERLPIGAGLTVRGFWG